MDDAGVVRNGDHWTDAEGNPAGGISQGVGFLIAWQNGPLGRGEERKEPTGAFVEEVIEALIGRLNFYQEGRFPSDFNETALRHLSSALDHLKNRTRDREARNVEGLHTE